MMFDELDDDEELTPSEVFMSHIHDILEGGRLVVADAATIKTDDGVSLPMTLFGIAYDETAVSFFALALNPELIKLLDIKPPICQTCIDEQAAAILNGIDLDADLENLQHDHPHDQPEE